MSGNQVAASIDECLGFEELLVGKLNDVRLNQGAGRRNHASHKYQSQISSGPWTQRFTSTLQSNFSILRVRL